MPGSNAKVELLRGVPLFAGCSGRELARIAKLADELDVSEGEVLTREGERGREFFAIVDGTAEVRRGRRKVNVLGAGDFFGEIALVTDRPRTATVTATSPMRVLVLTARDFRTVLREVPSTQLKVIDALGARLPDSL